MQLGIGLYRHLLTRANFQFARQAGATPMVAHLVASMASLFGLPLVIAYTAAKAALTGMVRGYAVEFSPHGVRVYAVAPGWTETEISRKALEGGPMRRDRILSRTPMGRLGVPADIGWAAVYLASPAARFVSGVTLPVDGGVSIGF